MTETIAIRVFDEKTEISKIMMEDVTVLREGIITGEFQTSALKTFTDTAKVTISVTEGATGLILWCEDDEDDGDEFHIQVLQYLGLGVDLDGDGTGTISTSAEASLNGSSFLLVSNSIL